VHEGHVTSPERGALRSFIFRWVYYLWSNIVQGLVIGGKPLSRLIRLLFDSTGYSVAIFSIQWTWCPTDLQHLCCKALINK